MHHLEHMQVYGSRAKPFFAWSMMLVLISIQIAIGQPFFISGEGRVELVGGFSYDFLQSPLDRPFDRSMGKVSINVPINISQPINQLLSKGAGDFLAFPDFSTSVQQSLSTSIDISTPFLSGSAYFAVRENASLNIRGNLGNTQIDLAEEDLETGTRFRLRGGMSVPLLFETYWRTLTFGYTMAPTPWVRIGFQFHNHIAGAKASGDLRTSLSGNLTHTAGPQVVSVDLEYTEDKVYGTVNGSYHGDAWSPEIAIQAGPIYIISRMGLQLDTKGKLTSHSSVPFFIDDENFALKYTELDSFITSSNLPRLLNGDVEEKEYNVQDGLVIRIPQSHTIGATIFPHTLEVSYTKTFGHLETFALPSEFNVDSNSFEIRDILNSQLAMEHLILIMLKLKWLHINTGLCTFNLSYRDDHNLLSGIFPWEIQDDPLLPILNLGTEIGKKGAFSIDLYISPLPALRTGYRYVF